jgi:hypothetical protein
MPSMRQIQTTFLTKPSQHLAELLTYAVEQNYGAYYDVRTLTYPAIPSRGAYSAE